MENIKRIRIAIIWTEISGYLVGCLRELTNSYNVELLIISNLANRTPSSRRQYDENLVSGFPNFFIINDKSTRSRYLKISQLIESFSPDAILMAFQWKFFEYSRLVRHAKKNGIKVIGTMDNTWRGDYKQYLMSFINRTFKILPFDAIWVPGERAAQYAKRLFINTEIWNGLYCADTSIFKSTDKTVRDDEKKIFLFAGRLVKEKGLLDLISAYQQYRSSVSDPWELLCVGEGPLKPLLQKEEGIVCLGFKQPFELAEIMKTSNVFILPSLFEPWGVVIHEAALSGLPILCSDACGASDELVRSGFNGYIFKSGGIKQLEYYLETTTRQVAKLEIMGNNSVTLAERYTTNLWASLLIKGIDRLIKDR